MIINHNMPALNTYNRLTQNNRGVQGALAKLSSGLRINKAADDAAGLAISEKMRSQIRGLDQAGRNAQDGISLIQTAEGALNETHSILQRMRELSVQAANDTNTSNDRNEIQKEINQLKDEVNRIANTTEFNTKKLLDGTSSALVSTDQLSTKVFMRDGLRVMDQFGQKNVGGGNFEINIWGIQGKAEIQKSDIMKIKHTDPNVADTVQKLVLNTADGVTHQSAQNIQYGAYWNNVNAFTAGGAGYEASASSSIIGNYIAAGGTNSKSVFATTSANTYSTVQFGNQNVNYSLQFTVTSVSLSAGMTYAITGYAMSITGGQTWDINTTGTVTGMVTADITVNIVGGGTTGLTGNTTFMISGGSTILQNAAANSSIASLGLAVGDKSIINVKATNSASTSILDDVNVVAVYKNDSNFITATTANATTAVNWAFTHGVMNNTTTKLSYMSVYSKLAAGNQSTYYDATKEGTTYNGSVSIEAKLVSTANNTTQEASFLFDNSFGKVASLDTKLYDIDRFWDASGNFLLGSEGRQISIVQGDGKTATINLYGQDTLRDVMTKLNAAIANQLGQSAVEYVGQNNADKFVSYVTAASAAASTNNLETVEGTFVIRSAIAGKNGQLNFVGDDGLIKALSLQTIQASAENKFRVDVTNAHLTAGATAFVASAVMTEGNVLTGVVHPNVDVQFANQTGIKAVWDTAARTFTFADSQVSAGNTVKQTAGATTYVHLADRTMVLHIGANQLQDIGTGIGNMGADALDISGIQVTSNALANEAIGKLDRAIARVSGERSKMGALQNRLEHTINNLSTTSENLTAAESRIRDVDMAKEMMNFTKYNILSQAATSMLAQANQLPQGVLQLLR